MAPLGTLYIRVGSVGSEVALLRVGSVGSEVSRTESDLFALYGSMSHTARASVNKTKLLQLVAPGSELTNASLARVSGVSEKTVQRYLTQLRTEGKIRTTTNRVKLGFGWVTSRKIEVLP
jgi:predicted HTH transcriptional regulator